MGFVPSRWRGYGGAAQSIGAGDAAGRCGIEMKAEKQVCLAVVGDSGALVERHRPVFPAREHDPDAQAHFDERPQPACYLERQHLLLRTTGTPHSMN